MNLNFNEILKLSTVNEIVNFNNIDLKSDINNINIDSRKVQNNDLFIAIKGDNFDGHNFVEQVKNKNAVAAVVSKKIDIDFPQIIVKDTIKFLGECAQYYKTKFNVKTIAVTGSCGKTTVKEMIAAVLKPEFNIIYNQASFNNHIGVPLTIFRLKKNTQILISEIGMNNLGEIDYLSKIIKPDIGIITNVNAVHLEGLKTIENVAKAKKELLENLDTENGLAILNWDNEYIRNMIKTLNIKYIKTGLIRDDVDITFDKIELKNEFYYVKYNGVQIKVPIIGYHNVYNLLLTCAVVSHLKVSAEQIKNNLSEFEPPADRMNYEKINNITVFSDCYNANPESVKNAIKILSEHKNSGKKIFVFGDMAELGNSSEFYHKQIGEIINQSDIDLVLLTGEQVKYTYKIVTKKCKTFIDKTELINYLKNNINENDAVLIKASNSMKFNEISKSLKEYLME
jgi:UDP-N-acetylmuramoyl-tripeptide--D-alanyl-D-alanine ligase